MRVTLAVAIALVSATALGQSGAAAAPPLDETITVTASRRPERIGDSAASVITLDREALATSASVTLDETLRQVPGFALFRRAGSRFAHPTAQGVSLRGIGASGASRALVLDDGVPLNDPFGGWVQWGLVPRRAIERIEILRGGGSDLYGSAALSGVIQLVRAAPDTSGISADLSYGSDATFDGSLFSSGAARGLEWHAAAQRFSTDGYVMVPLEERGAVDVAARSEQTSGEIAVHGNGASNTWSARATAYDEDRDNGTPLQVNATSVFRLIASGDAIRGENVLTARAFALTEEFDAAFTAIDAARNSERLTRLQHVPVDAFGASATWSRVNGRNQIIAGGDLRSIDGETREIGFAGPRSFSSASGGSQRFAGAFVEDIWRGETVTLTGALRFDFWGTSSAFSEDSDGRASLPSSDETEVSPRASILWKVRGPFAVAASAYRSFRAPTLNELYRGFRVGNVVTSANPLLGAESLTGDEAGINLHPADGRASLRARLFWNEVEDTVANVTLSATPTLIERQRRNLGTTRSRGLEVDGGIQVTTSTEVRGSYLRTDAEVVAFAENRALEGNRLPQVPDQEASMAATYRAARGILASAQLRWVDDQFEDDRNELTLASFTTVDLFVEAPVSARFDIFGAVENVFDERVEIGRTPTVTLGPPRLARVGVRVRVAPRVALP